MGDLPMFKTTIGLDLAGYLSKGEGETGGSFGGSPAAES